MNAEQGIFAFFGSWLSRLFKSEASAEIVGTSVVNLPQITQKPEPISWTSGMAIDADGCPRAYALKDSNLQGLDYLENAGHPGNWFGVVTDTGKRDGVPVRQGKSDPAPGYLISPTSLQDKSKSRLDPRRYVDSSTIPYVVTPPELLKQGIILGDVCWVSYGAKACGAIIADVGPKGKRGEGSMALATALGINSSPKHGGTDSGVTFTIFPGSSKGWPRTIEDVQQQAEELMKAWLEKKPV
jgi:hypothetical protein